MLIAELEQTRVRAHKTVDMGRFLFLLKELFAVLTLAVIVFLVLGALWLAYNRAIYLLFVFFAIVAGGLLIPYLATMSMLHPKRTHPQITPSDVGIKRWENVRFLATDGVQLSAWYIPPDPKGDGATLVFVHGLGGNRGELLSEAAMLARYRYGALLLDLRNHGHSQGKMATLGYAETEDVRGAVKFLLSRPEVNHARIGLIGHSMGGATVLRAAARIPQVRVVVAQSAYSSIEENVARGTVVQAGLPPFLFAPLIIWLGERLSGLRLEQVRPIDDVPGISPRAILFIHGKQDHAISVENSLRLYYAANEPKELYLLENAGHKKVMSANPTEYEKRVVVFLDRHLRGNNPAGFASTCKKLEWQSSPVDAVCASPHGKFDSNVGSVVRLKIEQEEQRWF